MLFSVPQGLTPVTANLSKAGELGQGLSGMATVLPAGAYWGKPPSWLLSSTGLISFCLCSSLTVPLTPWQP